MNQRGQFKLYRSLRGTLIQSLKVFNDVHRKSLRSVLSLIISSLLDIPPS